LGLGRRAGDGEASRQAVTRGEFKHATVLFADVVSSTELVANLDPEQAMNRLEPIVTTMREVVERFDGTVIRTLGDGIMATFGAPSAQEGHALLACEAAIALQEAFSHREEPLAIRVGLHSGEVVSDAPVADLTGERGAYGLAIHIASRLTALAEPGETYITADTLRLVRHHCETRVQGRHALKGISEPVEIHCLLGLKSAVESNQFRGANLSTFRGRNPEIGLLQRNVQSIGGDDARVVGIVGAPGTGKSRICHEFAEWCRERLIPVFETRAQLYGHATPLQPVLELLRAMIFRISPLDDAARIRKLVAEQLREIGPTFEFDLPILYEFLGVSVGESRLSQLPPKTRHARLLEIVRHLVRRNSAATSVVIIEDLHWLDEASEDFVATLVDAIAGTATMLVLNYRPSYTAPWMRGPNFKEISLGELDAAEMAALVQELTGDRAELHNIRQLVVERSGGNPFFAEELVRSLAEKGVLAGVLGDLVLGEKSGDDTLPATVQAVLGARIDRLGEPDRTILQIGSIIGKEVPLAVLARVATTPLNEIERCLARLIEGGLIRIQSSVDGRWYAFHHPLIQEVAYGTQLRARRSQFHALVAKAMEEYYGDRLDEFSGLIAYHYESAGQFLHAAKYIARAAAWISSTSSAEALKHWRKLRQILRGQPRSSETDVLRILASGQISWVGWREGLTTDEAKPFIEEALGWARETDDTMIPLLLFVEGRMIAASGGPADIYVARVKEALSLLGPGANTGRAATLNASLSQAFGWAGLFEEALAANDAALEGADSVEKFDNQFLGFSVLHWATSLRGRLLVRLGRFAEATKCLDAMLALDPTSIDPTVQFIAHLGYIDMAWSRGDADLAEQHAARVAELANRHGSPYLQAFSKVCEGIARAIARDYDGAIRRFTAALEFVRSTKAAMEYEAEILAYLADCFYRGADHDRATTLAREAIEIARQRSARLAECRASIICGAALLAAHGGDRRGDADALFRRAEELIRESGAAIYAPLLAQEREKFAVTC